MGIVEVEEGRVVSRSELEGRGVDWSSLEEFLKRFNEYVKRARENFDIEEVPPRVDDENFYPGGWIGYYPLERGARIVVVPRKIGGWEYENMRNEIVNWLAILGAPFIESMFPCFPSELLHREASYMMYSRLLIYYTEVVLGHQLPKSRESRRYVGLEVRGRPLWGETLKLRAKDPMLMVSERVGFTFHNLLNLLVTRFHAELAKGLRSIQSFSDLCDKNLRYHIAFLSSEPFCNLLDRSLDVSFDDSEIIEEVRKISRGTFREMMEIADLWEMFVGKKALFLDVKKWFDIAIKPLSKIYELWCLKKLCDAFSDALEVKPIVPEKFPGTFTFRGKQVVKIYYNQKLREFSKFLAKIGPGRPDYVITFQKEGRESVVCVGDAKYREFGNIGLDDYQRLLSYILDYMYPAKELVAFIFHVSEEQQIEEISHSNVKILLIPLRPKISSNVEEIIKVLGI